MRLSSMRYSRISGLASANTEASRISSNMRSLELLQQIR